MEMMYDDKKDRIKLPRNIKQIGKDIGNIKIYIEDYAYSFIRDIHVDRDEDGRIGVMLGEIINEDDLTYIMVKGAAEVTNVAVYKEKIAFTEETWPVINKTINAEFQGMVIVGWYLVSSKITMNHMEIIKKAHRENFKDKNNIFFMYNPADADESFYANADGWSLMDGFKVFYERNEQMQAYMTDYRNKCQSEYENVSGGGEYRKVVNRNEHVSKSVKRHLTFVYGLSMLLLIVVLIIGVNAINSKSDAENYTTPAAADVADANKTVAVETESVKETETQTEADTEAETKPKETKEETKAETKPEPTTAEPTTAEPTKAAYTTYTIAQGDTLYKVCEKFYGSASNANIDKIVSYNGLDSANGLHVGDVIKIPQ